MPETMFPGRPGRGYDPTGGFTDLQWYMYHQNNVAFFAAFIASDIDRAEVFRRVREFVLALPHVTEGFRGSTGPGMALTDEMLAGIVSMETVPSLEGLPDSWLNSPAQVADDAGLPLFRVRVAQLADGPDAEGRRAFMLVRLSHAFAEGEDSALLSRSQSAEHHEVVATDRVPALTAAAARGVAGLAAAMHLIVARLWTPHPGRIVLVTRAYPRKLFFAMARHLGVNQRALFAALVAHAVSDGATARGKKRLTTTYSTIDHQGGQSRDRFMRMRMRFAQFDNAPEFATFARGVEARFEAAEAKESGFNSEMNSGATRVHRRLARLIPWAYSPRVFAFMPYDFVFGLIPPHRLGGPLVRGVIEPVYAGALLPGVVGCVVVPGRAQITFSFSFLEGETGRIAAFDAMVAALAAEVDALPPAAAHGGDGELSA